MKTARSSRMMSLKYLSKMYFEYLELQSKKKHIQLPGATHHDFSGLHFRRSNECDGIKI